MQGYLRRIPRLSLHHKAWLLWASIPLDDLMTPAERAQTIKDLLDLQRDDGGWSLKSLGDWKRTVAKANDEPTESDGYATGLILYVLRQASVLATREPMRRGVDWLKTHQRASGCWFTRSVPRRWRAPYCQRRDSFRIDGIESLWRRGQVGERSLRRSESFSLPVPVSPLIWCWLGQVALVRDELHRAERESPSAWRAAGRSRVPPAGHGRTSRCERRSDDTGALC